MNLIKKFLVVLGLSYILPLRVDENKAYAAGSCTGADWAPSSWTTPTISNKTDSTVDVYQWFLWDSVHMQNFKNLNANYQHEMRRDKNVWNFIRLGPLGLYCFLEMATNLPNPDPWWSEESDWWAWDCPKNFHPEDEEAQIIAKDSASLQANKWYYCVYRFERVQKDVAFTLQTESEYCKGYPFCYSGFDWCYHTRETFYS